MFAAMIRWSIDHATAVLVAAGVLLVVAGITLPRLAVDVFPELNAPTVVVLTEAGGLAADEVETQVTVPLESALAGIPGLRRLRSSSAMSLSLVWAEFGWGEDVYRARTLVAERLAAVRAALPPESHAELAPISSITGEILLLSLSSPDSQVDPLALRSFAEYELRNHLLAVPGVSQVVAIGGALPEYHVDVRQEILQLHGLTVADVADAARKAHSTAAAGYLPDVAGQELAIRQSAQVRSPVDISNTLLTRTASGGIITIGDVADVELGGAPARGSAAEGGRSAVIVSVQKSPGTNTLALTAAVDAALDRITVPEGMVLNRHVFRQEDFIRLAVDNLLAVLRDAVLIVAAVLVLFLLNARATVITLTALPLSLAVAVLGLHALGLSLNVMTLGGLAVAIGALVDDAIIDVENVVHRLHENAALPLERRQNPLVVVYTASNEIRASMVFATLVIVLVFVPLLFLQGLEGRFFRPLGLAYIISIVASLLVALTVIPALCALLLKGLRAGKHQGDGFLVRWLKALYRPILGWAVRRVWLVGISSALLTVLSIGLATTFGSSFLPEFKEGTFTVFLMAPPGTSLAESDRIAAGIEQRLVELPGVRTAARRTGRAERDEHAEPVSSSELEVTVKPGFDPTAVRAGIDAIIAQVPGITTMIGQPIEHRLSHVLSGTPAALAINVFGENLGVLRATANTIAMAVRQIPGARDVAANREILVTSIPIAYRHADLARAGLTPADAAEQVQQAISGERVAVIADGLRRYDLVVRLHPENRADPKAVQELILKGQGGALVRLREVGTVGEERSSYLIAHEGGRRKATISCNVADGANLGHLVAQVRTVVDPLVREAGLTVHYGGQFEAQQEASRSIAWMGLGVIVVIFLLTAAATGSGATAALVLVNLPLALIGGIAAIFWSDSAHPFTNILALLGIGSQGYIAPVMSIASLVGFITLFGIAIRNGILLVNRYQARQAEGEALATAVIEGSLDRLVAILMTAISAALGLLPLAWTAGQPGSEILAPLAIVVLGGLTTSTALNLLVVPATYVLIFARRSSPSSPSGDTP